MRIEQKTYYYFENKDKIDFYIYLTKRLMKMSEFANECGISLTLLSLVVNGKRAITKDLMKKFKEKGFNLDL